MSIIKDGGASVHKSILIEFVLWTFGIIYDQTDLDNLSIFLSQHLLSKKFSEKVISFSIVQIVAHDVTISYLLGPNCLMTESSLFLRHG